MQPPPTPASSPSGATAPKTQYLHSRPYPPKLEASGKSVRDYLLVLFKYKHKVLITFVLAAIILNAALAVYVNFLYTPLYEARSLLLVKMGWEQQSPNFALDSRLSNSVGPADIINSELSIMQSQDVQERVINALGAETIYPKLKEIPLRGVSPRAMAMSMLNRDLKINPGKGNILEVTFTGKDAAIASRVVNQLVSYYIEKRINTYKDPKSLLFLERKAEEYRQKLAEAEDRLSSFKNETQVFSYDDQRTSMLNQRMELASLLDVTRRQIIETKEKITELEKQLNSLPKDIVSANDRVSEADSRLLSLRLQERDLVTKFREDNRLVVNVRNQIKMVEDFIQNQRRTSGTSVATQDPIRQQIQTQIIENRAELSSLLTRSASLEQQIKAHEHRIQALENVGSSYQELVRAVADNTEKYGVYQRKLEEAMVHEELERQKMTSVSIIEPAAVPGIPVNQQKPLILLIAGALAMAAILGLGLAFLLDYLHQTMSTPQQAEKRLGLPILVTVPFKN